MRCGCTRAHRAADIGVQATCPWDIVARRAVQGEETGRRWLAAMRLTFCRASIANVRSRVAAASSGLGPSRVFPAAINQPFR